MVIQGKRRQLTSLIIAMLLLTAGAFVLGHNQVLSDPSWLGLKAPPARLNITSNPQGAHVLVNGNTLGVTPLDVEYQPREESIEVQVFKAQHENYQQWFKIKPGGIMVLDVNLKSKIR